LSESESHEGRESLLRRIARHFNPFWLYRTYRFSVLMTLLVTSFIFVLLWKHVVIPIDAGQQGVYWSRFYGGTRPWLLREGTRFKLPWDKVHIYDIRLQVLAGKTPLLTSNGMVIEVEWSARFHPRSDTLPDLHRRLGPTYVKKVVGPEVISAMRQVIGNFKAEEIYARDEKALLNDIAKQVMKELQAHPIVFNDVMITRLLLPKQMAAAIVKKLIAEQRLLAYEYRLKAEEEEKKRRTIEAEGIKIFEATSGIKILKWRGIEATLRLAESNNTKIVVIGTSSKGLPIILNTDK